MENFIINNDTIAIKKNKKEIIIYDYNKVRKINKNIKNIINTNCLFNGSNYKGRIDYAKKILNIKYKVPIIINERIILLPLISLRNDNTLLISLNKIINYEYKNKKLIVYCSNNMTFMINISESTFEKMVINSLKLKNILNSQK